MSISEIKDRIKELKEIEMESAHAYGELQGIKQTLTAMLGELDSMNYRTHQVVDGRARKELIDAFKEGENIGWNNCEEKFTKFRAKIQEALSLVDGEALTK